MGWYVYKDVPAGAEDPLKKPMGFVYKVLQNKYYFDELYDIIFIKPAIWFSETVSYLWMDRKIIDGILHFIARIAFQLGTIFRDWFDVPVVNGFGDFVGESTKKIGKSLRVVQTGRVQQYMLIALVITVATLFYYLFSVFTP